MKIEDVQFQYLANDRILDIGDGSQDALLVHVIMDDGSEGWGECEAAPLVSIAAWCCPMSHQACKSLKTSVIGFGINEPEDIFKLTDLVRRNSFDLLQADHTLSGIDIALWDMLGKKKGEPVWKLLGMKEAFPKTAYASQLFGDTPQETFQKARESRDSGYRAAKFGWGPIGRGTAEDDAEQIRAAREGLGPDRELLIDAGTVWVEDVARAEQVLPVLEECKVVWLEEPFTSGALKAYARLAEKSRTLLAGGEGAHAPDMACNLMDFGKVGFIQIDTGRIGGISSAWRTACAAQERNVAYVNHTFTTHLALAASLMPFAGRKDSFRCEYPVESSEMARALTNDTYFPDENGQIRFPDAPGLGIKIRPEALVRYGKQVSITYENQIIWESK